MKNKQVAFNVCLLQPSGYHHSLALLEAAEFVNYKLRSLGWGSEIKKNRIVRDRLNIIFGAHLQPEKLLNVDEGLIIFNTEQLPSNDSPWTNENYKALLSKNFVWDYSPLNIETIKSPRKSIVNFTYCRELDRVVADAKPKIDVLFYGSMNEKRKKILEALKNKGLRVEALFGVYGKERDNFLGRSRCVLNLNFYDSAILPQIRNFYPLTNGIPVISESCASNSAPIFHENSIFVIEKANIVNDICELLSNPGLFESEARGKVELFRNSNDDTLASAVDLICSDENLLGRSRVREVWRPTRMNLGSGKDYQIGVLNVDVNPDVKPDLLVDLSKKMDFPFVAETLNGKVLIDSNQFEEIVANDVLEHVPDLCSLMTNCLEILEIGGRLRVKVPYDLSYGAWQDPTHIRAFNERSWLYYTEWFWYLGWTSHRFVLQETQYQLSELGAASLNGKVPLAEILRVPRAVDSMTVVLEKVELSFGDIREMRARASQIDFDDIQSQIPTNQESSL